MEEQKIPQADSVLGLPDDSAQHICTLTIAVIIQDFDIARNNFGFAAAVAQINPEQEEARSFRVMMPLSLYNRIENPTIQFF